MQKHFNGNFDLTKLDAFVHVSRRRIAQPFRIEMAFPQETKVIVKSLPRKRKSDSDDDHNFHVIIAPGAEKRLSRS